MASLYATICGVDRRGVLVPYGDQHVFVLDNDQWRFDGHAIRYPTLWLTCAHAGTWPVVMAVGYRPYAHDVGVVDLGTHRLGKGGSMAVHPSITITFDKRDVTIQRPLLELDAAHAALPARRALPRAVRMLTGKR